MMQHPSNLRLGYILPWKRRGSQKVTPMSLESQEEWSAMIQHVMNHVDLLAEKTKGVKALPLFSITLVDLQDDGKVRIKPHFSP